MQTSTDINRKYKVNASYFENIDTEEKAYWLGFLWADGNIAKTAKRASGPNRMRLAQKWQVKYHLERFQTAIDSDYPIVPKNHENNKVVAQLDINCRPLCASLEKLGYDIKEKRIHVPALKPQLLHHFIRGYFDGDGGLSLYEQHDRKWIIKKQEWSITGNKYLMAEIKELLNKYAHVTPDVEMKYYKKSPLSASVRYGKKNDIKLLYDYLYKDATVYLDTKYDKFIEFFSR